MNRKQTVRIVNEWTEQTPGGIVYRCVKLWGAKSLLNTARAARAAYGQFDADGKHVVYSHFWMDLRDNPRDWASDREMDAEYIDDLNMLRSGNVDYITA